MVFSLSLIGGIGRQDNPACWAQLDLANDCAGYLCRTEMENTSKPIVLDRMSDLEVIIALAHASPVWRNVDRLSRNINGGLVPG